MSWNIFQRSILISIYTSDFIKYWWDEEFLASYSKKVKKFLVKTHVDENKNDPSEEKSTNCGWPGNQSGGREIRNVLRTIHFASTEISRNVMDVAYFWGYTYIFDVKERFDNIAITKRRQSCSFPNSFIIPKIIFMYQIQIT